MNPAARCRFGGGSRPVSGRCRTSTDLILHGGHVPNLWPWKDRRVPANRSFGDIVNGAPNSLRSAPDGTRNGRLDPAKSAHDFGLSLPWPTLLCAAIAIVAFSGSIYCA